MKVSFVVLSIAFFATTVEPAQLMNRGDKNSNLAIMLAYQPNSEIQMRDLKSNKSRTYKIAGSEEESDENVKKDLLEAVIKEKLVKLFSPNDDRKTVKRENKVNDYSESHENFDEAKVVEVSKKVCYKDTYKNVLKAFEDALKSQIDSYKKCVSQKKKLTTIASMTEATTTENVMEARNMSDDFEDHQSHSDENDKNQKNTINNNAAIIDSALNHKEDTICFSRQYAFMLNKLLDQIPCKKQKRAENPIAVEIFNGKTVKRAERNNKVLIEEYQDFDADSESLEIDVTRTSSVKPKTTTMTVKPAKKESLKVKNDREKMNEQILAIVKEHLSSTTDKSHARKKQETSTKKQGMSPKKLENSPKKITIKAKQVKEEKEEETEEFSQQKFIEQLQELFQKFQANPDQTFPVQSKHRLIEPTSSLPPRKSFEISPFRNTVNESSDESTEASVKLKSRKLEKERVQVRNNSRKAPASRSSAINHNTAADNTTRESYRSAPRADDAQNNFTKNKNVPRNSKNNSNNSNNSKKSTYRASKNHRASTDNRPTSDLAKKVSDFARSKSSKKQEI